MKIRKIGFVLAFMGLVMTAVSPVLAAPVQMKQVKQILKGNYRQGGDNTSLDLRLVGEGDEKKPAATAQDPNNSGTTQEKPGGAMTPQEEVQEDITVESCDCPDLEDIPAPKGRGFPKWLLGLGALPLVCLTGVCTSDNPPNFTPPGGGGTTPTPTPGGGGGDPTPTPPVPEPATLLLFGSGLLALGAAARRRRSGGEF